MARKGKPSTLQDMMREEACRLTLNALKTILRQEKEAEELHRKLRYRGKRKRTYSSDGSPMNKKTKTEDNHQHDYDTRMRRKRRREQDSDSDSDDEDNVPRKRRRGSDEDGSSHTRSSLPSQQQGSRDDLALLNRMPDSGKLAVLKRYFSDLTPSMWTTYGNSLIDRVILEIKIDIIEESDNEIMGKTIEYLFSAKLLSFSTSGIECYCSGLENIIFDKLMKCRLLEILEMTVVPSSKRDVAAARLSLPMLGHLRSLSLLPSSRFSYHWVVSHLARHCHALRELKIVYNGDLFDSTNELERLQRCDKLISLWLYNFGRNSEMKAVRQLMESLKNLKVLFHKELPNAILDLQRSRDAREEAPKSRGRRHLNLQRVDLCWHQRAIGYQLVYVPSSHLLQVAEVCPEIKSLNLVGPPCLAEVIRHLPHLHVLILQQASLTLCLGCALKNLDLRTITELRMTDVWDVTHDIVSAVACSCPHLQVLNIINSSLEARGDLQTLTHRPPFPHLRQMTLVPHMIHSRPPLTTPSFWQLGAQLTSYLLSGASQLTDIWLCYKEKDIQDGDLPTAQCLDDLLSYPRLALHSLQLDWPPAVSPGLVRALVLACPALAAVSSITTWPLTSDQRKAIVMRYGRRIDIT